MMDQDGTRQGGTNLATRDDERLRELLIERLTSNDSGSGAGDDEEPLLSVEPITRFVRITLASIRKHLLAAALLFLAIALLVATALGAGPQYQTTATVLLAGDSSLGGTAGTTSSAATQAESVILNRDNLEIMVESLALAENEPDLPVLANLRDSLMSSLLGSDSLAERRKALADTLEQSIFVTNDKDANLSITVVWSDPEQAVAIAQESYQSFVRSRRALEVEPLRESVNLLTIRADEAAAIVRSIRDGALLTDIDGAPNGSALEGLVRAEQDLLEQLRLATVELDRAEAGVTTRYSLLAPPQLPDSPISGNLVTYFYAIVLAGVVTIGVFYLLGRPRGRIAHPWQLEDLGVPTLGKVTAQNSSLW